jgi:hypothetical protein
MNAVLDQRAQTLTKPAILPDSGAGGRWFASKDLWWLVFVGIATALLCAPFLRTIYAVSDEGILLNGADRILRGQRLYTDFFAYLPPGGFLLVAGWFAIAGISLVSARVLLILAIVGLACFTFMACRLVSRSVLWSALLVLGWVVMSQGVGTQISHHWFTALFAMICAWASIASIAYPQQWLRWPLIAGLAAGAAGMVTPHQGAFVVLAATTVFITAPRPKTQTGLFLLATAVVPMCLLLYVIGLAALKDGVDDVIVFNATRYAADQSVSFARDASQQDFPLRYLFPAAAILTLLTFVRNWRAALHDRIFRSCMAYELAAFVACFPRPDMFHIAVSIPLEFPLAAYCIDRLTSSWRPLYSYLAAAVVIGVCMPAARAFSWAAQKAEHGRVVSLPRGNIILSVDGAQQLAAHVARTPAGAAYFFYPVETLLPFLTGRPQVGRLDWLEPEYSTPAQYQDACVSMMKTAQWIVVARMNATDWKAQFPSIPDPEPKERMQFERIMDGSSEFVAHYGWFELRRRVPGLDESACTSITR